MASDTPSAACTISGARQFGSTVDEHQAQASDAGDPRGRDVVLADLAHGRRADEADIARQERRSVTATMVLARLGPSTATMRMASTRPGTEMIRSITRMIATSTTPPTKAATSPSTTPTATETTITERPMNSETRAP